MGGDYRHYLAVLPVLALLFLLARRAAYYLRPVCRECKVGRLVVVERWYENEKLRCDHCGAETWEVDL